MKAIGIVGLGLLTALVATTMPATAIEADCTDHPLVWEAVCLVFCPIYTSSVSDCTDEYWIRIEA